MRLDECLRRGLLKRTAPDPENARRSLELSMSAIEDSSENMRIRRYRVVVVFSYTAMFHAARAILLRDGVKERSHERIPVYIKESYPELEKIADTLDAYRRLRHDAIYGLDLTLDEAEARAALESATGLLQEIKEFMGVK